MNNRKMSQDEQSKIISLMADAGFTFYPNTDASLEEILTGMWFEIPLADDERETIARNLKPNHFEPRGYRGVMVFNCYITSHVRGTYRAYRGRKSTPDYDTHNIFSFLAGYDNPVENCKQFIKMYQARQYNRS